MEKICPQCEPTLSDQLGQRITPKEGKLTSWLKVGLDFSSHLTSKTPGSLAFVLLDLQRASWTLGHLA